MKKTLTTLIMCGAITSSLQADATNISDMFTNGDYKAKLTLQGEKTNKKTANDSRWSYAALKLYYRTDVFNNFRANFKAKVVQQRANSHTESIIENANLNYKNDIVDLTIGRQDIEEIYTTDADFEAIYLNLSVSQNLNIVMAYIDTELDDIVDFKFEDRYNKKGEYLGMFKYNTDDIAMSLYYSDAPDQASQIGTDLKYTIGNLSANILYNQTNEDVVATKDGSSAILDLQYKLDNFTFQTGYIQVDKNGVGSFDLAGNFSPLEINENLSENNAKTYYAGVETEISGFTLSAIYGTTSYDNNHEKEFDIRVQGEVMKDVYVETFIANLYAQDNADDKRVCGLEINYKF